MFVEIKKIWLQTQMMVVVVIHVMKVVISEAVNVTTKSGLNNRNTRNGKTVNMPKGIDMKEVNFHYLCIAVQL
jgi:hypothetical protein